MQLHLLLEGATRAAARITGAGAGVEASEGGESLEGVALAVQVGINVQVNMPAMGGDGRGGGIGRHKTSRTERGPPPHVHTSTRPHVPPSYFMAPLELEF